MRGLADCRVLVAVFTAHANGSEHVGREVAKAFSMGLAVIPFRIEAINPGENLGYFLETVQWLDATTPPWQKHLGALTNRVKQLLAHGSESGAAVSEKKADPIQPPSSKRRLWIAGVGLAAIATVIAAAVWFFILQNRHV